MRRISICLLLVFATGAHAAWTTLPAQSDPPTKRHECAYVGLGDRFYLMGGRDDKPTEAYDPATDAWSSLGAPPIELHHFQGVTHAGLIYVIGAMTGPYPGEDPVENVLVYNPVQDAWYEGPPIPPERRRGEAGAVVVDDLVYVAGGQLDGHVSGTVGWTDTFDPETGAWTALGEDMPHPRDHFHLAAFGGALYALGGRVTTQEGGVFDGTVPEVDVFDIGSGQWSTLPQNVPTERAGTTSAVIGDQIVIIGGESGAQKTAHAETELWDVSSSIWQTLPSLGTGRHGTQVVPYLGQYYVVSGSGNRGGSPELTSQECYLPGGTCTTPAAIATAQLSASVAMIDFGDVGEGFTVDSTITISHAGTPGEPTLTILDAFVIGRDHAVFDVSFTPVSLDPGEDTTVDVFFHPDAQIAYGEGSGTYGNLPAAALSVDYAPGRAALTVPLSGRGVLAVGVGNAAPETTPLLSLVPNPMRSRVRIELSMHRPGAAAVRVFGTDGALVAVVHEGPLSSGAHRFDWAPPSARVGVYFVRAGPIDAPLTRKLVVVE